MKYPNHYFVRYEGAKIVEIYRLTGKQVYDIIVPKLKRKFATVLSKKDPRLGASVTKTEIKEKLEFLSFDIKYKQKINK